MKETSYYKFSGIQLRFKMAFLTLLICTFISTTVALAGNTINLTYSGFMPPTHGQSKLEAAWCEEVGERTNGRVKITHYSGQTLTQADQNFQGVKSGMSDIGSSVLQYTRGRFPIMDFINLPMGYPTGQVATAIINEVYEKFAQKEFDEVKVLYLHAHGPGFIHTKGKPVHKMEDLKGLKIRSHGPTASMIKALGGTPTAFPMNELYQSLQKGVVQGGLYPLESNKGWKMAEVTDYVIACYPTAYSLGFYVVMNKDKWELLSKEDQEIIEEINSAWIYKHGKTWEAGAFEGINFLLLAGNSMIGIDPKEASRWKEACQPVIQEYIDTNKEKSLPGKEIIKYVETRLADFNKGKFESKYMEKN